MPERAADAEPPPRAVDAGSVEPVVEAIHATGHKLVLAFAGAGANALARLHAVGGSSRTVLSAIDVYAPKSMVELIGFSPSNFTVPRVARAMAAACFRIALRQLDDGSSDPVVGIGSTATIATDRLKRGEHRVALAARDRLGNVDYTLVLEKGARDRAGEEDVVSLLILRAIADSCGVLGVPRLPLTAAEELAVDYQPAELLAALSEGDREAVLVLPDGGLAVGEGLGPRAILSGAFNPLHEGHLELASTAAARTGLPALFELPLMNAAKSPITLLEARRRAHQFAGKGPIALTRTPLFADKAELFPGSVFVVGLDTAERIVQPRFYGGDHGEMLAALARVRANGCRFLVAGRSSGGSSGGRDPVDGREKGDSTEFRTLADVALPDGVQALFSALGESDFRRDISSTEIRAEWAGAAAAR